jgi:hypothetical protein
MNEQLPPIDARLREQLARRSEGGLPEGLLAEVTSGLDAVSTARPSISASFGRPSGRTSGALVALAAVVALLAALVAVPALRNGPASSGSYPTDRPLTTAELAALMAGPALATNTALVADVTIQPNPDVCPMDRYPTLGVVEGMPSQVCVMTSSVTYDLQPSQTDSGVFAFRYLAPGVLGLLGKITAPSSGLAFKVTDDWPAAGKAFVVDGWLGSSEPAGIAVSCAVVAPAGDVLSPNGTADCPPTQDWLADDATPSALASPGAYALARQSIDPTALFGDARLVGAYGARQIDSIEPTEPNNGPVYGQYVVRSQVGPCPGASPVSSFGCGYWLVLAKLADITPPSTATESPSLNPISGYPIDRALTTAELSRVLLAPTLATNTALVADVTIGVQADACSVAGYQTLGIVEGATSQICVVESVSAVRPSSVESSGPSAFRYLAPGVLGLLGRIEPASSSRLSYSAAGAWDEAGTTRLVEGWLSGLVHSCPALPSATPADFLNPGRDRCTWSRLSATQTPPDWPSDPNDAPGLVSAENAAVIDGFDEWASPVHGVWVVRDSIVLARLADITLPSATPSPAPPATPQAPAYPTARALTTAELGALLDAGSLKQYDTVVVDAEVTAEASGACQTPYGSYGEFAGFIAGIEPQVCVYVRVYGGATTAITPGHLVLRVLGDRTLGYMGTVPDGPGGLAYSATDAWPDGFFLVRGWLDTDVSDCGQSSLPGHGGPDPLFPAYDTMCHGALTSDAFERAATSTPSGPVSTPAGPPEGIPIATYPVPQGGRAVDAAPYFELPAYLPTTGSKQGTYLVDNERHCSTFDATACEDHYVLARLADVTPPPVPVAPTPTPTSTPTPTPAPTAGQSFLNDGYPAGRALTADDLGQFLDAYADENPVVVARVTLGKANCPTSSPYVPMGNVVGLDSVCVVGIGDGKPEHSPASAAGTFVFRVFDAHTLGFMANVSAASPTSLSYAVDQSWPTGNRFLVTGWLVEQAGFAHCYPISPTEVLDPGQTCGGVYFLTKERWPNLSHETPPPGSVEVRPPNYEAPNALRYDMTHAQPIEATYLVKRVCADTCDWQIMARLDSRAVLNELQPVPSPTPRPTPTATAQATSAVGLWGSGDRPLTVAELFTYWRANHTHSGGQIVVAKGPFPAETGCWVEGASCASGDLVPEGYWALQFDAQGGVTVLGELSAPGPGFVWTIDDVKASSGLQPGDIVAVDGLLEYWLNFCDIQRAGGCSQSWLVRPDGNILSSIEVQEAAYTTFTSSPTLGGPNVRGVYLIRWGGAGGISTVIARLETDGSNP